MCRVPPALRLSRMPLGCARDRACTSPAPALALAVAAHMLAVLADGAAFPRAGGRHQFCPPSAIDSADAVAGAGGLTPVFVPPSFLGMREVYGTVYGITYGDAKFGGT